jgi:hypothetical protein
VLTNVLAATDTPPIASGVVLVVGIFSKRTKYGHERSAAQCVNVGPVMNLARDRDPVPMNEAAAERPRRESTIRRILLLTLL